MSEPSEYARSFIGKEITWTMQAPRQRTVTGIVDRCESVQAVIVIQGRSWPAVRWRIKPNDGSRAVWTNAFADRSATDAGEAG